MKFHANRYLPQYAIIEKCYINHFPIPAHLPGSPIQIIICPNYENILHKLLFTPWAILVESHTNHCLPSSAIMKKSHVDRYLPLKQLLGDAVLIIIYPSSNYQEIQYKSLSTPCPMVKKYFISHDLPPEEVAGNPI